MILAITVFSPDGHQILAITVFNPDGLLTNTFTHSVTGSPHKGLYNT